MSTLTRDKSVVVDRTVEVMVRSGALMRGHFKLTSGLHSDEYCQCARALERPEVAEDWQAATGRRMGNWANASP